jgi:hypothetical protein
MEHEAKKWEAICFIDALLTELINQT